MSLPIGDASVQEFYIGQKKINVKTDSKWIVFSGKIASAQVFLIENELIFIQVKGEVTDILVESIAQIVSEIIDSTGKSYSLISKLNVPFIQRDIRKKIVEKEAKIRNRITNYYFVANGRAQSILLLYKVLLEDSQKPLYLVDSLKEAVLQHFHHESEEIHFESIFKIDAKEEDFPVDFKYKNQIFTIDFKDQWKVDLPSYKFSAFLINKAIYVYRLEGHIEIDDLKNANAVGVSVLKEVKIDFPIVVSDLHGLVGISKKARGYLERIFKDSNKNKLIEYTYPNSLMKAVLNVQHLLNPYLADRSVVTKSFQEAIEKAIGKWVVEEDAASDRLAKIDRLSVDELKRLAKKLFQDKQQLIKARNEHSSYMIDEISQLTFKQEAANFKRDPDPNDPYYDVLNSFQFLQMEIIQLLEELNALKQDNRPS